jgi:type I restriction enzyme S subunit
LATDGPRAGRHRGSIESVERGLGVTIVSKASAYPKSVQSGLPRLGACPPGWTRGPLSAHLIEELRPLNMADDEVYELVTVRRSRGGVVLRERLKGSQIAVKSQFRIKAGDFLISKRQIVHGACGIVPPELDGAIVSNEYSVLRARPSLDLEFLNYLAHSVYFQQTCFHSSIGVHVEKMIFKLDAWLKWDFNLPPAREQSRITEILATWDRAIEAVQALIASARQQKTGLMQELLTRAGRLPGSEENSKEWAAFSLGEIFTFKNGLNAEKALYGSGVKFVNVMDVFRARTLRHAEIAGSMSVTDNQLAEYGVRKGDVLFNRTSETDDEIAMSTVYLDEMPAVFGGFVIRARPRPGVMDIGFSVYAFQSPSVRRAMVRLGQGGIRANIGQGDLATVRVLLPPLPEQKQIAAILTNEDRAIETLQSKLAALRQEKAALMQQLLTGKRRVTVAESEAA